MRSLLPSILLRMQPGHSFNLLRAPETATWKMATLQAWRARWLAVSSASKRKRARVHAARARLHAETAGSRGRCPALQPCPAQALPLPAATHAPRPRCRSQEEVDVHLQGRVQTAGIRSRTERRWHRQTHACPAGTVLGARQRQDERAPQATHACRPRAQLPALAHRNALAPLITPARLSGIPGAHLVQRVLADQGDLAVRAGG